MLAKIISLIAFAALAMAAPQSPDFGRDPDKNGDRTAQMARVEQLRAQGLNCNEAAQGSFVCSDGFGGDWYVHLPSMLWHLLHQAWRSGTKD
ncbi:Ff.00g017140.m01.CDS01 [Fusarium sp. VM40]|nr:Ff.00g017140.m01.CDS01 [Fusarium sp. VM40]